MKIVLLALLWFGLGDRLVLMLFLLALLWPFTRLGLRWSYRAQAAQA